MGKFSSDSVKLEVLIESIKVEQQHKRSQRPNPFLSIS